MDAKDIKDAEELGNSIQKRLDETLLQDFGLRLSQFPSKYALLLPIANGDSFIVHGADTVTKNMRLVFKIGKSPQITNELACVVKLDQIDKSRQEKKMPNSEPPKSQTHRRLKLYDSFQLIGSLSSAPVHVLVGSHLALP